MERHLAATELKRDRRTRSINHSATRRLEHGLDSRPLNVAVDGVGQYLLKGLALRSIHRQTIALLAFSAITGLSAAEAGFRGSRYTIRLAPRPTQYFSRKGFL